MQTAPSCADYLESLNPRQRQAASYGFDTADGFRSGPLLVIAGAGTGKTMTLAHRVAHLIVSGVKPERILLLTFTRRAAREMTRRADTIVRQTLKVESAGVSTGASMLSWSGTFHSIANRILRHFASNIGIDPGFSVLDRTDAADVIDVIRHELGLSRAIRRFPKKDTCLAIYSRCVNASAGLDTVLRDTFPWCLDWEAELRNLFRAYVQRKQHNQMLDYDDLLLYWNQLLLEADFAAEIGSWFDHILVDEYQDTNHVQAQILHSLVPSGAGLTVVGDDAQSIYAFRAARVDNILEFPGQFEPPAKTITLEQNYRSTQPILDSANCLIAESARQYRKRLVAAQPGIEKPCYVTVEDCDAEAQFIVESVLDKREKGFRLMDQAVLFRSSHHSDRLELELVRRNIPYVKYGGLKFLEAAHVKDLLAVLKWAENPKNEVAAFRVLKLLPGMGPANARRCIDTLQQAGYRFESLQDCRPPAASRDAWPEFCTLLQSLAAAPAGETAWQWQLTAARRWYGPFLERLYDQADSRTADLDQLEQVSAQYPTRERFLTELTLEPPAATGDLSGPPQLDEDYLVLSTVHSAKGQEWESVMVLNVTDGSFPSEFAAGDEAMIEEERRLLYVAMTRAKQHLTLVTPLRFHTTQQHRYGDRHVYGARSRFLSDALLATMQARLGGRAAICPRERDRDTTTRIDIGSRVREMW